MTTDELAALLPEPDYRRGDAWLYCGDALEVLPNGQEIHQRGGPRQERQAAALT